MSKGDFVCKICTKPNGEESLEFPGWCNVCAEKYGYLEDDNSPTHIPKVRTMRDFYE